MSNGVYAFRTIAETLRLPTEMDEDLAAIPDDADLRAAADLLMARSTPSVEDVPQVEVLSHDMLDRLVQERHTSRRPLAHLWFYPEPARFAAFLSHDVDEVEWSWRRRLLMAGRHPRTLLTKENPYWNFEKVVAAERNRGVASTFFVAAFGTHPRDPPYTLRDIADAARGLETQGWEVGLHTSYESFDKPEMVAAQMDALRSVLGHPPVGVRQHFLHFASPETWKIHEQAGLVYDSSMGSRERPGFRTGFCHPYRPDGVRVLEVPLTAMDSQLFWHERLDGDHARERTTDLIRTVVRYHGVACLNWHQHVLDELSFPGWWDTFLGCLEDLVALKPWFVRGSDLAHWWNRRARIEFRERAVSRDSGMWDVTDPTGGPGTVRILLPDPPAWKIKVEGTDSWRVVTADGAVWVHLENLQRGATARVIATRIG